MKISTLETFIDKYNINKNIEQAIIVCKNKVLSTRAMVSTKSVIAEISLKNFDGFEDVEFAIARTEEWKRKISSLSPEKDIVTTFEKDGDRVTGILLSDGDNDAYIAAADKDVIPKPSVLKVTPVYDVQIVFSSEDIESFIRSKNATPESDHMTLEQNKKGGIDIKFGHSNTNSSFTRMKTKATPGKDKLTQMIHFSGKYLKEIFNTNKEFDSATLDVCTKGLARVEFSSSDQSAVYYLSAHQI